MSTLAELFGLDSNASTDDLQQAAVMLPDIRDYHAVPVSVTPEIAGHWLRRNDSNRPIRKKAIAQYVNDLKSGNWQQNGETVKFGRTGRLLDGQHRIAAIAASGIAQSMLVVTGVADEAFDTIDTGRRRTSADVLIIEGTGTFEARIAAAALPMIMNYRCGLLPHSSTRYPNHELLSCWMGDAQVRTSSQFVAKLPHRMVPISRAKALFLHWAFSWRSPSAADSFMDGLFGGDRLEKTDSIYHLRERLLLDRLDRRASHDGAQLHACIKAWNAARAGKKISSWRPLFPASNESFPEISP
ncbi:hypothetical protein [Lysobacter gummosus]|uniref:ParB-like nuclease domain protein n=1 Tax=Lysobacter gummosus TaxID=262324 RepID=A0ABY3XCI8_9GAMM|nr:hypothetical protein [Lysobacter gummosus]ALN93834.1 hypothetical protein LG3211_4900 [Lysobacter gummosus]UNP29274.1 hypothetical protein MOV92_22855 [Lysobacter gummosus]